MHAFLRANGQQGIIFMAQFKGHIVGGFIAWLLIGLVAFSYARSPVTAAVWLLCAFAGALFPDVDIKSKGQKLFYFSLIPLYIFLLLKGFVLPALLLAFAAFIPLISHHRGLFHAWWFLLIVPSSVALAIISYLPAFKVQVLFSLLFFIAGAFSHLWLDFGIKKMFR